MENPFLQGREIETLKAEALKIKESDKAFSDIVDAHGHYYVDLVQQGGGVLGIGLVGYTYLLEEAGIRFYSLAGTSAGAINSLLMAGLAEIGQPVSTKILRILAEKDLFDFVDGPKGIKRLIQKKVEGKSGLLWNLLWNACSIYRLLKNQLGLNPGKNIEQWMEEVLTHHGISSFGDLEKLRQRVPELKNRLEKESPVSAAKIAVITSEIDTHTKVELPRMANLYWRDFKKISPAKFVRASMSVPYFFYPFEEKNIPGAGTKAGADWNNMAGYYGEIPAKVRFVDGGLLSNFPINVFHIDQVPAKPTFGARLSTFRENYAKTDTFFDFSGAIINTMRQIHDYEVILKNPDYRQLICHIDANREFDWLNFNMSRQRQKKLFLLGAKKGLRFLQKFDWTRYKETRQRLLHA